MWYYKIRILMNDLVVLIWIWGVRLGEDGLKTYHWEPYSNITVGLKEKSLVSGVVQNVDYDHYLL